MKGCPLNNFEACREDECLFYQSTEGGYVGCIIINHYISSLLNSVRILDLIGVLIPGQPELSSELSASELKEFVENALVRLQSVKNLLKDAEP